MNYVELQTLLSLHAYYKAKDKSLIKIGTWDAELEANIETTEARIAFLADLILNPSLDHV